MSKLMIIEAGRTATIGNGKPGATALLSIILMDGASVLVEGFADDEGTPVPVTFAGQGERDVIDFRGAENDAGPFEVTVDDEGSAIVIWDETLSPLRRRGFSR